MISQGRRTRPVRGVLRVLSWEFAAPSLLAHARTLSPLRGDIETKATPVRLGVHPEFGARARPFVAVPGNLTTRAPATSAAIQPSSGTFDGFDRAVEDACAACRNELPALVASARIFQPSEPLTHRVASQTAAPPTLSRHASRPLHLALAAHSRSSDGPLGVARSLR